MLNIQYLRELCEKATKGPWELVFGHNTSVAYGLHGADGKPVIVFRGIGTPKSGRGQNNIRLIAATREAMPELLDRVEALEKVLVAVKRLREVQLMHHVPRQASEGEALLELDNALRDAGEGGI